MSLLKVFHENRHHHIDQHKLGQQDEHNKEERSEILWIAQLDIEIFIGSYRTDLVNTTILQAVIRVIALLSQGVFHDSIPVIPCQIFSLES